MFVLFLLALCPLFAEEPWGKDADLEKKILQSSYCTPKSTHNLPVETLISFHQSVISPISGPRSHFRPSSSGYMRDAVRRYGFFRGVPLGLDRLMRENNEEWVYRKTRYDRREMKFDPVK